MRIPLGKRTLAVGALAVAIVAAGVSLAGGSDEEASSEGDAGPPTIPLERRDLVARESVEGALGYAGEALVVNRVPGTITWLPAAGDVIGRGERLLEVDGAPVLLMYGDVPAYRDLAAGVAGGPDVAQLESNLSALGHDPGEIDDEFTATTAAAVADWQDSEGLEATGEVELGRVAFLAGARRVGSLAVSLGDSASGGEMPSSGSSARAEATEGSAATVFASDGARASQETPEDGSGDQPEDDPTERPGKQPSKPGAKGGSKPGAQQPAGGAESETPAPAAEPEGTEGGSTADAVATEVMTTTSTRRVVTIELDPADAGIVRRGSGARVELPGGEEVKGRVASVGTVAVAEESEAATGEESESDPTIEVTVSLPDGAKADGLDQAPVTVELTDEIRRDVFAVPVEALLGTAGGNYAVVAVEAGERRQFAVEPGLFADGYVEIEGEGLTEGIEVEVPGE